jgi:transposase-like protein
MFTDPQQKPGFSCPQCKQWIALTLNELLARDRFFCMHCGLELSVQNQESKDLLRAVAEMKERGELPE